MMDTAGDVVDVVFGLRGGAIARDYAYRLWQSLNEQLVWLEEEAGAGIHPLYGASSGSEQELYLNHRARLILRLPAHRAQQASSLRGTSIDLGGTVEIGAASVRELRPHAVLYSRFVSTGTADEIEFLSDAEYQLRQAGIAGELVCGRARTAQAGDAALRGFALMVHGLTPQQSLQAQRTGLGEGRKIGCGIFVPHKSVAAVGT